MAKHVDYFKYMSYDLHGLWDRGNKWTGAFLDAHTNLTELRETMDLLWRNKISPDQVVLGLAFYGRAFTVQDSSCTNPGCIFASGGKQGECSREVGVLLNSEIDEIRSEYGVKPTLDKDAAVQLLTWDNDQWVSYDDKETFRLRLELASEFCLGGVMVWAVSHDTQNVTYPRMLSSLYTPPYKPGNFIEDIDSNGNAVLVTEKRIRQCRWTGCGETCQAPYVTMRRNDPGHADGELMLDGLDCPDDTVHTLCCPFGHNTQCGWFTHNNGNCDSSCPRGRGNLFDTTTFEVGSVRAGLCHKHYQSACCIANRPGTALHSTLVWAEYPGCDHGECGDDWWITLAQSTIGSGDALCNARHFKFNYFLMMEVTKLQERKLCYNDSNKLQTWDNCRYHRENGLRPEDSSDEYCSSACPESQVRLARDNYNLDTCDGGARAFCCDDNFIERKEYGSTAINDFKAALNSFLIDGICPREDSILTKRDIYPMELYDRSNGTALHRRDDKEALEHMRFLAKTLGSVLLAGGLGGYGNTSEQQLQVQEWDLWVKAQGIANLAIESLRQCAQTTIDWYETRQEFLEDVVCRLEAFSSICDEEEPSICQTDICAPENFPELCEDPEELEDGEGDIVGVEAEETSSLQSRARQRVFLMAKPKTYQVQCASGADVKGLPIYALKYPRAGIWAQHTTQYTRARQYQNPLDCANPYIDPTIKSRPKMATTYRPLACSFSTRQRRDWYLVQSLISTASNVNSSGRHRQASRARFTPLVYHAIRYLLMTQRQELEIGRRPSELWQRLAVMTMPETSISSAEVNGIKSQIFGNKGIIAAGRWKVMKDDLSKPGLALHYIKATIAVWHYILDPQVKASWVQLSKNVRSVLKAVDDAYYTHQNQPAKFLPAWNEWYVDWVNYHLRRTREWVAAAIKDMNDVWGLQPNSKTKRSVKSSLIQLESIAAAILVFDARALVR